MANRYPSESTTDAPPPKRKQHSVEHKLKILLKVYPADVRMAPSSKAPPEADVLYWTEEQVSAAVHAAYDMGRRDEQNKRNP